MLVRDEVLVEDGMLARDEVLVGNEVPVGDEVTKNWLLLTEETSLETLESRLGSEGSSPETLRTRLENGGAERTIKSAYTNFNKEKE